MPGISSVLVPYCRVRRLAATPRRPPCPQDANLGLMARSTHERFYGDGDVEAILALAGVASVGDSAEARAQGAWLPKWWPRFLWLHYSG